jgi:hypothetical protein
MSMKEYHVQPQNFRFSFTVKAENSREAYFEAVKLIVFKVMNGMVTLDIVEGDEIYKCEGCSASLPMAALENVDGELLCGLCICYRRGENPFDW